jgi:hypothetical protein
MGITQPPVLLIGNQSQKPSTHLPSTWPLGGWYYDIYGVSSYPNNYGTLLNFTSVNKNAVTQIYHTWDNQSGAGGTTAMWARSNRDLNNAFGAWQPVLLGEQGSNDGLVQKGTLTAANQSYTGGSYYYDIITFPLPYKSTPKIYVQYATTLYYASWMNYTASFQTATTFRIYWVYGATTTRQPIFDWIAVGEG